MSLPDDLMDNDQQRPTAYAMDALVNGNWIVQTDDTLDIMSKPPFSTWLIAGSGVLTGGLARWQLSLPSMLSMLAIAWLLLWAGGRYLDRETGWLAALLFLCSSMGIKHLTLIRTDPVFAALTFASVLIAWQACKSGRGWWLVFWLLAALGTLTKGPLGLLLALGAMPALWRFGRPAPRTLLAHGVGILLFLFLTLGWFLLAYQLKGQALIDKMLGRELMDHAVGRAEGLKTWLGAWQPTFYFISRFFPWSLLTLWTLWRLWGARKDASEPLSFQRYLALYFLVGIALFSLAPHRRADHILPLVPAASMLAASVLIEFVRRTEYRQRILRYASMVVPLLIAAVMFILGSFVERKERDIMRTQEMHTMSGAIRAKVGERFPLFYVKAPYALQFGLGTMAPKVSREQAALAMASDYAAFAIVREPEKLQALLPPETELYELLSTKEVGGRSWKLVGNRPELKYYPKMAGNLDALNIFMDGVHLQRCKRERLTFWATRPDGHLELHNTGSETVTLKVTVLNLREPFEKTLTIVPGEKVGHAFNTLSASDNDVLRFGVIADCRNAHAQLDTLARTSAFKDLAFLVVNGDFVYEAAWRYRPMLDQMQRLGLPVYFNIGNHDIVKKSPYPYEAFQNHFGYLIHGFEAGPAKILFLESSYKRVGAEQIALIAPYFRQDATSGKPRLVFCHVPPQGFRRYRQLTPEGKRKKVRDNEPFLAALGEAEVDRLYCGHRNVYEHLTYSTPHGEVKVLVSGGGGEKTGKKKYQQHWVEVQVTSDGVRDQMRPIATPGFLEHWRGRLIYRNAYGLWACLPALKNAARHGVGRMLESITMGKLDKKKTAIEAGSATHSQTWA